MTLHHEMCQMGHFYVSICSERKFYALCNGEHYFQRRELVAELHVFEYGGTALSTFEKLALDVEDFYVKALLSNHEP